MLKRILILAVVLLTSSNNLLAQFEVIEPEPFRGDEIEDRSFDYNEQSFIDRFSYRFRPEHYREWELHRQGVRISAGSISSTDMYTVIQLRNEWFMNDWLSAVIRHRRDEDFDSRYDRTLFGAGIHPTEHFSFRLLADVQQEKQDIDLYFEFEWQENPHPGRAAHETTQTTPGTCPETDPYCADESRNTGAGSRIRFVTVLADAYFNGKSSTGQYETRPVTLFGEGVAVVGHDSYFHVWVNYNPELQLEFADENSTFEYRQVTAGARFDVGLTDSLRFLTRVRREHGRRDFFGTPELTAARDLDRDSTIVEAQFNYQLLPSTGLWVGTRYFTLDENDIRPNAREETEMISRNEGMAHAGVIWDFADSWRFAPGIYLNQIDNRADLPHDAEASEKDRELTGKLTLPLEHDFPQYNGRLIISPTLEFPGHPFGGLNVQVQFLL